MNTVVLSLTFPCFVCGQDSPAGIRAGAHLRVHGGRPPETLTEVTWCGHPQERLPWLIGGDRWRLIPVWDPALRPIGVGAGP